MPDLLSILVGAPILYFIARAIIEIAVNVCLLVLIITILSLTYLAEGISWCACALLEVWKFCEGNH